MKFKRLISGILFIANFVEFIFLLLVELLFHILFEFVKLHDFGSIFKGSFIFFSFCVSNSDEYIATFCQDSFIDNGAFAFEEIFELFALDLFERTL